MKQAIVCPRCGVQSLTSFIALNSDTRCAACGAQPSIDEWTKANEAAYSEFAKFGSEKIMEALKRV